MGNVEPILMFLNHLYFFFELPILCSLFSTRSFFMLVGVGVGMYVCVSQDMTYK